MADLLPRFYDVEKGGIFIDGVNIKDMAVFDLREMMGNVNQEAILFNDSFYNNITFGVEHATKEQVIEAAKIAKCSRFYHGNGEQYTLISETEDAVFRRTTPTDQHSQSHS